MGAQYCPPGLHALWGMHAAGVVGGCPRGAWPATILRGVRCQALSLPWQLVLWGGQPGFRDPCVPGAVGAGVETRHQSHRVRPRGPALRAVGVAEGRPQGGTFCRCEGRLRSGAPFSPAACPPGGLSGPAIHVLWARARGCGRPALSPWRMCPVGAACRGGGGGSSPGGGWPAPVARGIWCQALSLPWPPILWGGWPGFRDPCVPGAAGAGVGTLQGPHSVRPCRRALRAVGVAEGRPRGGYLPSLRGVSKVQPSHFPDYPPSGRAVGVQYPRAVGAGVRVWEPSTVFLACMPCGGCVPRGRWGAVPGGAGPPPLQGASGARRCPPPRQPVLWGGRPGFGDPCVPGPVGVGVGTQHGFHSARPCGPVLRAVGAAGGRPPGGGACRRCEGRLRSGAPPPPAARPLGGLPVSATHVLWAGVCGYVGTVPLVCMPRGGCVSSGCRGAVSRGLAQV